MGLVSLLPLFALAQPGEPVPPPPPENWQEILDADGQSIEGRRRPGYEAPLPDAVRQDNKGAVRAPPPEAFPTDQVPIPDRWRLIESLGVVKERWFDPYGQNTLKGDRPIAQFNPFSTGLQSALVVGDLAAHLAYVTGVSATDTPQRCSPVPTVSNQNRVQNGIQIFPGSVPIYRGTMLVGAIGVSGDGIDQDDMTAFLGTHRAGVQVGTIGNAPTAIRADNIVVPVAGAANGGVRLRYVNCPFNPFIGTNEQNVCQGK
jgi:hypothetical protein